MLKTKSFIQSVNVNGGRPKNATGQAVVIRAPKTMKCFRATFVVNNYNGSQPSDLWISSEPTNSEEDCIFLNSTYTTTTALVPGTDLTRVAPNIFIFDRRGVGYMEDEFYLQSDDCFVTIVWEGISEQ